MASLLLNHHDMDDEIDFGKVGGDDDKSGGGGKREKKMNRGRVVSKELFDLADDTHYSLLALTSAQDDAHMVVLVGAIRRAKEIAVRGIVGSGG